MAATGVDGVVPWAERLARSRREGLGSAPASTWATKDGEDALTEVPEYLLERSKARRRALGLLDDDGGGEAAAGGGGGGGAAAGGGGGGPQPTAIEPIAAREVAAPAPEPAYVTAARTRRKAPVWISVPVVAGIGVWAMIYVGLLGESNAGAEGALELGTELYAANCSTCHGAGGGGGVGRNFTEGELILTFPNIEDQFAFVRQGTIEDEPYGDPNRPGGQRIGGSLGKMPGTWANLTDAQLYAIIRHEREDLSGEQIDDPEALLARDELFDELEAAGSQSDTLPQPEG
jgi:Cytochrome c